MKIGCPKEIKAQEHRVGLVPSSVKELVHRGHEVLIESGAGAGIHYSDEDYIEAGARIAATPDDIFKNCELVIKVKEPQESEWTKLREGQTLFTYLHLAADKKQAEGLVDSGGVAIAYETVLGKNGRGLPLLAPMSEIAGRLSSLVGSYHLQKHKDGNGRLICGVPGVLPGKVLVLGGGVAGFNAARLAVGMGADVTIVDKDHDRLRFLDDYFSASARVVFSSRNFIKAACREADLVIGAVLIPGAAAPKLLSAEDVREMKPGAVVVDIAIDQGGCFETSRPTTHNDPTYIIDDVVHYCVANMPGAVPLTSALSLNHAVLPYVIDIAEKGWRAAVEKDAGLANGVNVALGHITSEAVADSLSMPYRDLREI